MTDLEKALTWAEGPKCPVGRSPEDGYARVIAAAVRDFLHEREWNPVTERYTGRSILSRITLLYDGRYAMARKFGIPRSFCIMTVETIAKGPEERP